MASGASRVGNDRRRRARSLRKAVKFRWDILAGLGRVHAIDRAADVERRRFDAPGVLIFCSSAAERESGSASSHRALRVICHVSPVRIVPGPGHGLGRRLVVPTGRAPVVPHDAREPLGIVVDGLGFAARRLKPVIPPALALRKRRVGVPPMREGVGSIAIFDTRTGQLIAKAPGVFEPQRRSSLPSGSKRSRQPLSEDGALVQPSLPS